MDIPEDLKAKTPEGPSIAELAREVVKQLRAGQPRGGVGTKVVTVNLEALGKSLIELATNAWRIRTRLTDPASREPREDINKEDIKKLHRFLEAIFTALNEVGLEVKDRTGEIFDYGLPEQVVSAQPQLGLTKELIIETIRPTIYWNSQIAQQGEVVIGTPPSPTEKEA
jgi:hypothetical protein